MAGLRTDEPGATEQRRARRRTLRLEVAAGDSTKALVHDLSEAGLLLETSADLRVGDLLHVDLPEAGATKALIVWTRGQQFGCEFLAPVPKAAVSAALLRSPHAAPGEASGPGPQSALERDREDSVEPPDARPRLPGKALVLAAAASIALPALVASTAGLGAALILVAVAAVAAGLLVAWGIWIEDNLRY